jgi:hypothetical protein
MQPTSSTASVGSGGSNSGNFLSGIGDSISSMLSGGLTADSLKFDPTKNAYIGPNNIAYGLNGQRIGGSSFGTGDFANAFFGFLASAAQNKIAKQQLALGREQLTSSKASYAGDALARAKEIDRAYSTIHSNMVYDPRLVSPSPFYNDPVKEEISRENLLRNNAINEAKSQDKLLSGEGLDDYRQALASWTAAANTARPVTTTTPAPAAQPVTNQTATDPRLQQQTY